MQIQFNQITSNQGSLFRRSGQKGTLDKHKLTSDDAFANFSDEKLRLNWNLYVEDETRVAIWALKLWEEIVCSEYTEENQPAPSSVNTSRDD